MFGKERKTKGNKKIKEKNIELDKNKIFFLDVVWYVERKESEEFVKLQLNSFK